MTKASGHRRSRQEAAVATREALLEAGVELLRDQPAGKVLSQVKAAEVARRAGVTIGAFYHHWDTQSDYVSDLVDRALARESSESLEAATGAVAESLEAGGSFLDVVMAGTTANLLGYDTDPLAAVELMLHGAARADEDLRDQLTRVRTSFTDQAADLYDGLRIATGREWRPPLTLEMFTAMLGAVVHGLSVGRQTTDDLPDESFGWIVAAVLPAFIRDPDDPRDLDAYLAETTPDWSS